MHEPDQRAPGRHAGNEALGAVDRIEHPDIFGVGAVDAVFLSDHAVSRKGLADEPAHRRLGAAVGFGHGIEHAAARFILGPDCAAEEGENHLAGKLGETFDESRKIDRSHRRRPPESAPGAMLNSHICHPLLQQLGHPLTDS